MTSASPTQLRLPTAEEFAALRFASEERMMKELLADSEVRRLAGEALACAELDAERRRLLASGLRVTRAIIPSLAHLVETARSVTRLDGRPVEIYVYNSPVHNASCLDLGQGRVCCAFSSSIVERLTPRELLFVIGHEMGHVKFRHSELPALAVLQRAKQLDPDKVMKLLSWSRRTEISADRAGMACCQDLRTAANALIKVSCGLGEPIVQFSPDEYLAQMKEIQTLSDTVEDVEDWYSTHPFSPLRVAAIHIACQSPLLAGLLGGRAAVEARAADERIDALLASMEPGTVEAREASARECLLWGGCWIAAADGQAEERELASIKGLTDEASFQAAASELRAARDQAALVRDRFGAAAGRCHKLAPADRCALVQKLIAVARADGRVDAAERAVLREICRALRVAPDFVDTILRMME